MEKDIDATLRLIAGPLGFVAPYIARQLPQLTLTDSRDADFTVALCAPGEGAALSADNPGALVLECPNVIGTGMTGLPRQLAAAIWRGTFFHIPGSDIPVATVHAESVARAVAAALGTAGFFTVTDGCAHTLDELADALSYRLGNKRILTPRPILARWLPGGALRRAFAAAPVPDGSAFAQRFDFKPVNVTEYLCTHVYDEESL